MHDYWSVEIRRLLWVCLAALITGYMSGAWLIAALLVACAYIGWSLYKLRQLQRWLVTGLRPERLPDSDGAWEQIAYLINRTHQKNQRRKKKQKELVARLNNIISALPDAVILFDEQQIIQWSNNTARTLLGIDKSDFGQRIDNLLRAPELNYALANHHTEVEIQFTSPRNQNIILSGRILAVQNKLRLLNVRDISQRVQLQRTRKAFIANASHELRTPLTVVSGYLELIENDPDLPQPLQEAINQSRQQTARMQQIIEDMLTLSRLENNKQAVVREGNVIDMPLLIDRLYTSIKQTIAADSHTLSLQIQPNLMVNGIENEITSVINNLLENAIKHTPVGTQVKLIWKRNKEGSACLIVEDDGPGIPCEHIEHLTERFYRVDSGRSRQQGGTGLGLSIVKYVMNNHGGTLNITSQVGKTQFRACFPPKRVIY